MKMTMAWTCPDCSNEQSTTFDFEDADSGVINFGCKRCKFTNSMALVEPAQPEVKEGENEI